MKRYDSTRTAKARADAIARREARLSRWSAKATTDAAMRSLLAPYRGRTA